jgi:arylsulfatase A-like enzyme
MSRLRFAALLVLLLVLPSIAAPCVSAADKPNIVIFLADDQGWGDLSVHGNSNLSTPNIDSLARDGALFERFYVCPVCSPTRAEFLTGRYHPRGGVWSTSTGGERLDLDEQTIAETFRAAGYATGAFGKWHNGMQYPYHPLGRGFDEYYGFCSGHWGDYFSPPLEHNGRPVQGNGYIIDDLTDHALQFIEDHRAQPFFCYLPYNTPHSPMQVPDPYFEKFRGADLQLRADESHREDLEFTRTALAMCENIDWNVGRVLKKLDERGLADNTLVLYFSDNGPNGWRWNEGMRGRKGSTDEGGVRSPLLVRWPGKIAAGTRIPQISAAIDLLPTLAELAGISVASSKPLDGISVAPLLRGSRVEWPDRQIFSHWNNNVSVRTQRFRLDANGRLYDMQTDPGQKRDVSPHFPEMAARLKADVELWKQEMLPGLRDDDRPFPVGYRELTITQLPARDAVPHGNVQRSARAPNCSFMTNWRSADDQITWDVDVHTAGRYEVVLYYTCAADDVGSRIQLSLGESRLEYKIDAAHDPPLRGLEHDRVDRGSESYVKEFKPVTLGVLELPAGRGSLALRALDVAGKQVADVRALLMTLQE